MSIKDAILPEFDHEMATTRKLLDRIPDAELGWKPHHKSFSMGELASHIAQIPGWAGAIIDKPLYDLADSGEDAKPKQASSRAQVVGEFDRAVAEARGKIAGKSDAELMAMWSLKRGGTEMFSAPTMVALKSFIINHTIHHRGQLSVYLRLKNVPVPSIYGPSADEGM